MSWQSLFLHSPPAGEFSSIQIPSCELIFRFVWSTWSDAIMSKYLQAFVVFRSCALPYALNGKCILATMGSKLITAPVVMSTICMTFTADLITSYRSVIGMCSYQNRVQCWFGFKKIIGALQTCNFACIRKHNIYCMNKLNINSVHWLPKTVGMRIETAHSHSFPSRSSISSVCRDRYELKMPFVDNSMY